MDTAEKPKRSWWRRKRWVAAGLAWLAAAYAVSEGPVHYAAARGWVSDRPAQAAYRPLAWALAGLPEPAPLRAREAYTSWWRRLGARHRTKEWSVGGPGWRIAVRSDLSPNMTWTSTVGATTTFNTRCGEQGFSPSREHDIAVEHGSRSADGGVVWDGPLTLDGRPVAALPEGTRRLAIGYFDGELSVTADGTAVAVGD